MNFGQEKLQKFAKENNDNIDQICCFSRYR